MKLCLAFKFAIICLLILFTETWSIPPSKSATFKGDYPASTSTALERQSSVKAPAPLRCKHGILNKDRGPLPQWQDWQVAPHSLSAARYKRKKAQLNFQEAGKYLCEGVVATPIAAAAGAVSIPCVACPRIIKAAARDRSKFGSEVVKGVTRPVTGTGLSVFHSCASLTFGVSHLTRAVKALCTVPLRSADRRATFRCKQSGGIENYESQLNRERNLIRCHRTMTNNERNVVSEHILRADVGQILNAARAKFDCWTKKIKSKFEATDDARKTNMSGKNSKSVLEIDPQRENKGARGRLSDFLRISDAPESK